MKGDKEYTAKQVAEWFLAYNRNRMEEEDADDISNLKLQKLLYYAQGCYLALTDKPLFNDKILAWAHGPVVNSVYQEYKRYQSSGIPYDGYYVSPFDEETESILEEVYAVFGKYSAWGLRNMTHREDPWKETPRDCEISQNKIKEYFLQNYVQK